MWQCDKQFGKPRGYHLQQADFDLAGDLVQLLQPFYKITLQLSTKASARIANVVIMIDQITSNLSAVIANEDPNNLTLPTRRESRSILLKINRHPRITCSYLGLW
jgi:hypothetical protein